MNRVANLLHAMSTAIADQQLLTMTSESGLGPSAVAAVLTLGQHEPQNVSDLASVTGLSHSATVRLVDRLESDGLVQRSKEKQGRMVSITLTLKGQAEYERARDLQSEFICHLVAFLSPKDQKKLEEITTLILSRLTTSAAARDHICRFCDEGVCDQKRCPVETTFRHGIALQ